MHQLLQGDYRAGISTLASLAGNGHAPSQYRLGMLYRLGLGVPRNARLANYWFERDRTMSADSIGWPSPIGGAMASPNRRNWLSNGSSVWPSADMPRPSTKSPWRMPKAKAWPATIRRPSHGCNELLPWLQRAIAGGHPDAARRLAQAYRNGELGLPRDPQQAIEWERKTQPARF